MRLGRRRHPRGAPWSSRYGPWRGACVAGDPGRRCHVGARGWDGDDGARPTSAPTSSRSSRRAAIASAPLAASPLWLRGKRSVTADLAHRRRPRPTSTTWCATADVLVVSGPPSRAARWGIDADAGDRAATRRSSTARSPGGARPDRWPRCPATRPRWLARSGRMLAFERQLRRGGPVFTAVPVAGHVAAHGAVQGILAALVARGRGGGAQRGRDQPAAGRAAVRPRRAAARRDGRAQRRGGAQHRWPPAATCRR